MSEPGKKSTVRDEAAETPKIRLEQQQSRGALASKQQVEDYLRRKAEVVQEDHQQFQQYVSQKTEELPARIDLPPTKPKFNRRNLLKVDAGTAVAGEAAAVGYSWVTAGSVSEQGAKHAGSRYAEVQRTLKISKIYPDSRTGKFDYRGTKGQKIEWEMVPMGELFVEEGTIPGDSPHTLTGADGTIWHPTGRWAATVVRLCGGIAILDAESNFDPVAFLQFNKDSPDQYPVRRIDNDHWEIVFDKIVSPGHEISGFHPMAASCA
jgi:hypothetical protein